MGSRQICSPLPVGEDKFSDHPQDFHVFDKYRRTRTNILEICLRIENFKIERRSIDVIKFSQTSFNKRERLEYAKCVERIGQKGSLGKLERYWVVLKLRIVLHGYILDKGL